MDFRNVNRNYQATSGISSAALQYDAGLRAYMLRIYNYMALALVITGIVAFAFSQSEGLMRAIYGTPLWIVVAFAPVGVSIYLSARLSRMSIGQAQTWFWVFSGLMGLSLSYIFVVYTGVSIARTFFVTAASYGALSLYGYTTKRDLSPLGVFLMMGVLGLFLLSIVNMFMQSPGVSFAVSAAGVFVFAGLTAFDTQRIKQTYAMMGANDHMAIMGALSLYLDFINLFVMLLRFIGDRR